MVRKFTAGLLALRNIGKHRRIFKAAAVEGLSEFGDWMKFKYRRISNLILRSFCFQIPLTVIT